MGDRCSETWLTVLGMDQRLSWELCRPSPLVGVWTGEMGDRCSETWLTVLGMDQRLSWELCRAVDREVDHVASSGVCDVGGPGGSERTGHCAAATGSVPASRYRPASRYSPRAYPPTLPAIEYAAGDRVRKVQHGGRVDFMGKTWRLPKAFRGYPLALRPTPRDGIWKVFFMTHEIAQLDLRRSEDHHQGVNHVPEHSSTLSPV